MDIIIYIRYARREIKQKTKNSQEVKICAASQLGSQVELTPKSLWAWLQDKNSFLSWLPDVLGTQYCWDLSPVQFIASYLLTEG